MANDILLRLEAEARGFRSTLAESVSGLEKLTTALLATTKASAQTTGGATGLASAFGPVAAGVTAVASTLTVAIEVFRTFGTVAIGALRGVADQAISMVGEFAQFDAAMRGIGAAVGVADYSKLAADITQLGIASEFTTAEVQKGALALAQLGATESTLKPLLNTAIKIAGVTKTDLARSAEIASTQMTVFGMSVKDAAQLSTLFIQAAGRSRATVEQLGTALSYAGGTAASVGNSIYDVVPALQALIDAGQDGSKAGTGLRDVMSDLLAPTDATREKINKLVGSFDKVNPATRKLTEVIDAFAKAGLTAGQAYDIFGKSGGSAIIALTRASHGGKLGAEALREYAKELRDTGAAEANVATIRDGVAFQWAQITASVEAARITFGAAIADSLGLGKSLAYVANRAGALVASLSQLTTGEMQNISLELVGPQSLLALQKAVMDLVGPMNDLMIKAGAFLARQIITYAPLVAGNLASAFIDAILASMPVLAEAFVGVASDFVATIVGGVKIMGAEILQSMLGTMAAQFQAIAKAPFTPTAVSDPLLDAAIALKEAGNKLVTTAEESSAAGKRTARDFAKFSGMAVGTGVAEARAANRIGAPEAVALVQMGEALAQATMGQTGKLGAVVEAAKTFGTEAAKTLNAGLSNMERLAARGTIRAAEFAPAGGGMFGADVSNMMLAIMKLADFAQRPKEDQDRVNKQMLQQREADARERQQQSELTAARARQAQLDAMADPRLMARRPGLDIEPEPQKPVTNYYDLKTVTQFGAQNSEGRFGPRWQRGEQPRPQGGTTGGGGRK